MNQKKLPVTQLQVVTKHVKARNYQKDPDTLDIFIHDFAFHSQVANNPKSLLQNGLKQHNGGKPKRTFVNGGLVAKENGGIEMSFHLEAAEVQSILAKAGKKKLRIYFPANGVPVYLGPDVSEKIKSLNKNKTLKNKLLLKK